MENDDRCLDSPSLCNKQSNPNPILGDGPLQMGDGRKEVTKKLQSMLKELGYYLGETGPDKDGVDGSFGKRTLDAVKHFQQDELHKDWEGNILDDDGLVGPRTSDALNREMVGIWYDQYQTDTKLTDGKKIITVWSDYITDSGLELEDLKVNEELDIVVRGEIRRLGSISEVKWEKSEVVPYDSTNKKSRNVKILVKTKDIEDGRKATIDLYQFEKGTEPTVLISLEDLHVKDNQIVGKDDNSLEYSFNWHSTIYDYKRTQYYFKAKIGPLERTVKAEKDSMIHLKHLDSIVSNPDDSFSNDEGKMIDKLLKDEGPWNEATEDKLLEDGHEVEMYQGKAAKVTVKKMSQLVERNKFLHYQDSHGAAYCYDHKVKKRIVKSGKKGPLGQHVLHCPDCKDLHDAAGVMCLDQLKVIFEKKDVQALERSPKILVFASCCQTALTKKFAKEWLDKGARWYIGWGQNVPVSDAKKFAKAFFKRWFKHYKMNPDDVRKAFDDEKKPYLKLEPRCYS